MKPQRKILKTGDKKGLLFANINEEEIGRRAYLLWEKAGKPDNSSEYFWERAKIELHKRSSLKDCFIDKNRDLTFLGHFTLSSVLAILVISANIGLLFFADSRRRSWLDLDKFIQCKEDMELIECKEEMEKSISSKVKESSTNAEVQKMILQQLLIESRIVTHSKVMSFFYTLQFASAMTIIFCASIAAVCWSFISRDGLSNTNKACINLFITSTVIILLFGNTFVVLRFEENRDLNEELYLDYFALYDEMKTYWATSLDYSGSNVLPSTHIIATDKKFNRLRKIALGFDIDKVSSLEDFSSQIENSTSESD